MPQLHPLCLGMPDPGHEYFAFTVIATEAGQLEHSVISSFDRWADETHRTEIRSPRVVSAEHTARLFCSMGEPCLIVNNEAVLSFALSQCGGHMIIRKDIALKHLADWCEPFECVSEGIGAGFTSSESVLKQAKQRYAAPKARMHILRRDNYRCKLCGRTPDDSEDLRLHVHHIREYAKGGPTLAWNQITLCQTCHEGIAEDERFILQSRIDEPSTEPRQKWFFEGLRRYREQMKEAIAALERKRSVRRKARKK